MSSLGLTVGVIVHGQTPEVREYNIIVILHMEQIMSTDLIT